MLSKEHRHDANDYATVLDAGASGCAPCGGITPTTDGIGALDGLTLKRFRRSHAYYGFGSFGRAHYSEYDDRISVFYEDSHLGTGIGCITVYLAEELGDNIYFYETNTMYANDTSVDGIYRDNKGVYASLTLYDSNDDVTAVQTDAVTAILRDRDGNMRTFEIFTDSTEARRGRLVERADRNGNATTIAYKHAVGSVSGTDRSKLRQIDTVTDPYGKQATFTYHTTPNWVYWRVASISVPNGTSISYTYDTANNLSAVTYPDGTASAFSYGYDSTSQFDTVTYSDMGATGTHRRKTAYYTALSYTLPDTTVVDQAPGIVRRIVNPLDETTFQFWESDSNAGVSYFYMGGHQLMRMATGAGKIITEIAYADGYVHDEEETLPDLSTVTWVTTRVPDYASYRTYVNADSDPYERSFSFDNDPNAGVVDEHTRPDGLTVSATWNSFRQPLVITDALGRVTTRTYDSNGNKLTEERGTGSAVAATWTWTYNGRGQPLTMEDANGNVTDYAYDSNGYLLSITEPPDVVSGTRAVTGFTYDSAGRVTTRTDAGSRDVDFAYDARNRVTTITYEDSSTETFTYGSGTNGNLLVESTDRNDNETTFAYDSYGRRTTTTQAAGTSVAVSEICTYLPGTTQEVTCTRAGELTTTTFDHRNRAITVSRQANGSTTLTTTTAWNALGQRISQSDPYGRRSFWVYDVNRRLARTVRELMPNALGTLPSETDPPSGGFAGTGTAGAPYATSARDVALIALTRPSSANPGYVIEDIVHDAEGQVIARIDARGIRSTFAYDAQGRLSEQVEADATIATTGEATLLAPPVAARTVFTYDDQGNRLSATLPRSYARSLPGGTWSAGSEGAFTTTWTYTGRNLRATETVADGLDASSGVRPERGTTTWTYTLTKQVATVTDPRTETTVYGYSSCCDRLISITDPESAVTSFGYDSYGNRTSVTDANGHTTAWTFDARHRVATQTNAEAETTTFTYDDDLTDAVGLDDTYAAFLTGLDLVVDSDGSAVLVTNPLSETQLTIADGLGRTVRSVDGNDNATTVTYDAIVSDLVETAVTDALDHVTRSRTDGAGLARVLVDAENNATTQSFDANGNRVAVRDPEGVGMDCTYDARDREVLCTDTRSDVATERETTFDAHSNAVVQTDALNQNDTCVYDGRDRKVSCTDRVNATTLFAYDLADNLIEIEDAEGGITDYVYDGRNLLLQETFPTGQLGRTVRTYSYDAGRRLTTRVITTNPSSAFSETTTYTYDDANRLLERGYPDGKDDAFTYDPASRLLTATSDRYRVDVERTYDAGGRLTVEEQTFRDGSIASATVTAATYLVSYTYDDANRTATITYPDGAVVTRTYTDRYQLATVSHTPVGGSAAAIIDREYDNAGRLVETEYGNSLVEGRTYIPASPLVAGIEIPSVTDFGYTYDANRRKTDETNGILAAQTQEFSYDAQDRLTGWERPSVSDVQAWSLSLVGDWNSTTRNSVTETRTHTDVHELTGRTIGSDPAIPLGYDAKGNLTDDGEGRVYTWDPENRLSAATVASVASPTAFGLRATYQYDALGRRAAKTVNGKTTRFLSSGAQVVEERDGPAIPPQAQVDGADSDGTTANAALTPPSGGVLPGTGVIRVNFQPATTAIPEGYYADKGKAYATRTNGLSYGWDTTKTSDAIVRNGAVPLPELDTLVLMEPSSTAHVWSIALPNGDYPVIVVAGDPLSTEQTNDLLIENQSVTDPDPSATATYTQGDFDGYAVIATVADGQLTISMRVSGENAKLCFVEIGPEGTTLSQGTLDRLADLIDQATDQTAHTPPAATGQRQFVYGSYIDEPVSYTVGSGSTPTRYFTHANHLYSIAATTNTSGAVVERYTYDAYGIQTVTNAPGTVELTESVVSQTRGFTGYIRDMETGLWHARARQYDSGFGRFVERDPLGYVDGFGLYLGYFVPNLLDPSGMRIPTAAEASALAKLEQLAKEADAAGDAASAAALRRAKADLEAKIAASLAPAADPKDLKMTMSAIITWSSQSEVGGSPEDSQAGVSTCPPYKDIPARSYKCSVFVARVWIRGAGWTPEGNWTGFGPFSNNWPPTADSWTGPASPNIQDKAGAGSVVAGVGSMGDVVRFDLVGRHDHVGICLGHGFYVSARNSPAALPGGAPLGVTPGPSGAPLNPGDGVQITPIPGGTPVNYLKPGP